MARRSKARASRSRSACRASRRSPARKTTDGNGKASFETTIPKSATVGQGLAAVLVKTDEFGSVDDRAVITIVK